jgi:DNA-binding beta-propeller fold protein YncE
MMHRFKTEDAMPTRLREGGVALLLVLLVAVSALPARGQEASKPSGAYHLVADWPHPPSGQPLGIISWISFDSHGIAYVFRRCAACGQHPKEGDPPGVVWMFDNAGNFLREWGPPAIAKEAHSLRIDRNGFIWITDTGAHQVKKLRPDGTLVMTLGKYGVPGNGHDTFNMPTDVFVIKNGDFFVTDGYGNQRVVKFSKDGKFIKEWGGQGTGPGQFRLPHSIVQDSRGRLIVSDRCGLGASHCTGDRIEIFDTNGTFLDQWTYMGGDDRYPFSGPCSLYITRDDTLYVGVNNKIYVADARDGKVRAVIETNMTNHGIAVDPAGDVYAAGLDRGGLHRFTRSAGQ